MAIAIVLLIVRFLSYILILYYETTLGILMLPIQPMSIVISFIEKHDLYDYFTNTSLSFFLISLTFVSATNISYTVILMSFFLRFIYDQRFIAIHNATIDTKPIFLFSNNDNDSFPLLVVKALIKRRCVLSVSRFVSSATRFFAAFPPALHRPGL